jgi:hypothetical protein
VTMPDRQVHDICVGCLCTLVAVALIVLACPLSQLEGFRLTAGALMGVTWVAPVLQYLRLRWGKRGQLNVVYRWCCLIQNLARCQAPLCNMISRAQRCSAGLCGGCCHFLCCCEC